MGKRIGILTGGGDVPGLNSVIKEVVYRGTENDCEVVGIRRGWGGLTHPNPDDSESIGRYIIPPDRAHTPRPGRTGGPIFPPRRPNPPKTEKTPEVLRSGGSAPP